MITCAQCQEDLVAHIEGITDPQRRDEIDRHLQACRDCQAELRELTAVHDRLTGSGQAFAGASLDAAVMDKIVRHQTFKLRRIAMARRYAKTGLGLVAAMAACVAVVITLLGPGAMPATAAEVLVWGIEAVSDLQSVYIKARMRTVAHDNFELIGVNYGFVDHEIWKQFGDQPRWRIDKPGRVVVMDGDSTLLWIRPPGNMAFKTGPDSGVVEWLRPLLNPHEVLASEQRLAQAEGSQLSLKYEEALDGAQTLVLTVEAKAKGDFTNDWCRNKSISASDNRRVYQFNADTHLLEAMQVYVHTDGSDVLVFEITQIEYNGALDPGLFSLTLPEDVVWHKEPEVLADNENYVSMKPDEVARVFFQACGNEDWDEVLKFWSGSAVPQVLKNYLSGVEIVDIGEPFQSGRYPGWFVPYEIKIASGHVKKHNLAVRNDNPTGRWQVDGGI